MSNDDDANWIAGVAEREAEQAALDVVIVDHRNWPAFQIFVECAAQWRVVPTLGNPPMIQLGLDYSAVMAVLRLYGTKRPKDTFRRIRLMERGALAAMKSIPFESLLES